MTQCLPADRQGHRQAGQAGRQGVDEGEKESSSQAGRQAGSVSCVDLLPNGTLRTQVQN